MAELEIRGEVAPGFEPVRQAFVANFEEHGDVGAGVAVYVDGACVVDLTGGVADPATGRPYDADTLEIVFSSTKGAVAICGHVLAQRGLLDFSAPVTSVWPEFGQHGKGETTIGDLFSHRAGVPAIDRKLSLDEILAVEPVIRALEETAPSWTPGSQHGYHGMTYGWLAGEIVRRLDGRSIGQFFAEEIAAPLGLEFYIGVPEKEVGRVAPILPANYETDEVYTPDADPEMLRQLADLTAAYMDPDSLTFRAMNMHGVFGVEPDGRITWNLPEVWKSEVPGAGGITNARSLAKLYAACVGELDGIRLLDDDTIARATEVRSSGPDNVLFVPTEWGLGFFTPSSFAPMLGEGSFGHAGAGGSLGFANTGIAGARVGFGYVMNQMGQSLSNDIRPAGLIEALRGCIG